MRTVVTKVTYVRDTSEGNCPQQYQSKRFMRTGADFKWIVLCWFTSLQICVIRKFSVPFLVKRALLVKSTQLPKKGSLLYCWRNHWQNSWHERKSSGHRARTHCKWYGYCNCSWRTCQTAMLAIRSAAYIQWTWVREFSYMYLSMCYSTSTLCASPSFVVYCIRVNSTSLPAITVVKCAWIQKSTLRIPVHVQC
jgi:hypothetical protein